MIGILNINKPLNTTSSQVVVKVKKLLGIKKVGHMGTLDNLASGVLLVGLSKATRLFDYFLKKQKSYIAQFAFGYQTDTLDLEGKIIKTSTTIPTEEEVKKAIKTFLGKISQLPPEYSSKKINGKTAYNLARRGQAVALKPCDIEIFDYTFLEKIDDATYKFFITCSAGTYIRSLARDLGEKLNTCATMTSLVRTNCGNFDLKNSIDIETATKESLINSIIGLEEVLKDFERLEIDANTFQKLLNGQKVDINSVAKTPPTQKNFAIEQNGKIIGIGEILNNYLTIKTYLM